ncbi:MAG: WD40 repeat domain-containing protein, partial [Chloroflexota bacterium]
MTTGELVASGTDVEVYAVAFSPDGRLFAWGDASGVVHVWGVPQHTISQTSFTKLSSAKATHPAQLSAWSSSVTDLGDLSVTPAAKLVGNYGMQAVIDDNTSILRQAQDKFYVRDDTPASESRYRTRFHFDPNSIAMADGDLHAILEANSSTQLAYFINFKFNTSLGYQVKLKVHKDDLTYVETAYYVIGDAPHVVEVEWIAATAAGANDGTATLWIDGVQKETLSGIDNDTYRVESVDLGAASGVDTGTRGTYYFDSFASNRYNFLGADAIMGSGRNSVTGLIGGQQLINNTPIFSGGLLPFTKGLSSIPTPTGPITSTLTTYSYAAQSATCPDGALSKPHAVTTAGSDTYCYDKNGNMVKRVEGGVTYTQTFDAENRLASVTTGGQTTTFVYDGDGNRVNKVKGTTATVYVG